MKHNPRIGRVKRNGWQRLLWRIRFAALSVRRDRLQCPNCGKIGTWKPHDPPPRYVCKWCGRYEDIRRTGWCRPCNKQKVWMLKPLSPGKTPAERCGRVDPWRG